MMLGYIALTLARPEWRGNDFRFELGRLLANQAADYAAQRFAIFGFHVHEFDAAAVGGDVADHGGRLDGTQASANFDLQGIANRHALCGLDERATESDSVNTRGAGD